MTNPQAMQLRAGLAGRVRHSLRYRGMLVLVLWQVPVQPVVRPNGSIGILIGGGSDEHAELSCNGELLDSTPVKHRVAALEADYDLSPITRVEAVAGLMRSDRDSHDGAFGTVLVRADWKHFGVGAGVAVSPAFDEHLPYSGEVADDRATMALPSAYLRGGTADGLHVRADLFPPTAFAAQQIARIGIGFNAVDRHRAAGFVGLAGVGSNEGATGIAADVTIPLADRFGVRMQGYYAEGYAHSVAGFAAGGRLLLGGAPPVTASLGR